ncbi:MAG: hypothetical protein H5U40_18250, partial [Polyangiaceae bacterium]|nr:hypothetical protein [Polyangiaceae bacterium]
LLGSVEALESARKAAAALARGAVSGSPHFRALVSRLGPRRSELLGACALAEGISSEDVWSGIERTIARLALLCSADREAVVDAAAAVPFASDGKSIRAELDLFERSAGYDGYWHERSGRR